MLDLEDLRLALPDKLKKTATQSLVDTINTTFSSTEELEYYRDNLLGYTKVLNDGRFKLADYLNAVKYVGFKVRGLSNIDSYSQTFPQKMIDFRNNGVSQKDISTYVHAYNKNKLVNLIYEQAVIPLHVMNQDLAQKAVMTLADLMQTAVSEKVRSDSAIGLLNHIKPPEVKKVELDMTVHEDGSLTAFKNALGELAQKQQDMISQGMTSALDVAEMQLIPKASIIEVETKEVK